MFMQANSRRSQPSCANTAPLFAVPVPSAYGGFQLPSERSPRELSRTMQIAAGAPLSILSPKHAEADTPLAEEVVPAPMKLRWAAHGAQGAGAQQPSASPPGCPSTIPGACSNSSRRGRFRG